MAKIYVINLRDSVNRRQAMRKQLRKFGLHYEFVDAFDGVALSQDEFPLASASEIRGGGAMSVNEIACVLSHRRACEAILRNQESEFAVILEDDVIVGPAFHGVLTALSTFRSTQKITLLAASVFQPVALTLVEPLVDGYHCCTPDPLSHVWGATAYFLSRDQAAVLHSHLSKVSCRADDWDSCLRGGITEGVQVVFPFPALHAELKSDIRPNRARLDRSMRQALSDFVHRSKPFPFYQLTLALRRRRAERRHRTRITLEGKAVKKTYRV